MAAEYLPDLKAAALNIVATYANDKVNVSALIENVGVGNASGPFYIAVSVNLQTGEELASYNQLFEVPAGVTLYGRPLAVLEPELIARPPVGIINPRPTSYWTAAMEVPLRFIDVDGTTYTAEMLVDPYYQVADANRANNSYSWPGNFWFMSLAMKEKKGPFVLKRKVAGLSSSKGAREAA
jgi:hypothetical protein